MLSGLMGFIILFYFVVPLVYVVFKSQLEVNKGYLPYYDADFYSIFMAAFSIFLFLSVFLLTYAQKNKSKTVYIYDKNRMKKCAKFLMWFSFLVGGGSFILYIRAFGGVERLFYYAEYLRSFSSSGSTIVGYWASILLLPARMIVATPLIAIMVQENEKRFIYKFVFVVSFVLACIFLLADSGKISILMFLLIYAVPIANKFVKHPWRWAILCAIICFPLIGVLDSLFSYISSGIWQDVSTQWTSYFGQLTYPWANTLNMEKIFPLSNLRWGSDYITGILNILPGISVFPPYEDISVFYSGTDWMQGGGTPSDLLIFGYSQFSYFGIIVEAILLGWLCGKADNILKQVPHTFAGVMLHTALVVGMVNLCMNADVTGIIQSQFTLVFSVIILLFSMKRKKSGKE